MKPLDPTCDLSTSFKPIQPRQNYGAYSQSDTYQGAELFNFYVDKEDLANPALDSVPSKISWTRLGPWLPWMQLGDKAGQMVYHARGSKLEGGIDELPADIQLPLGATCQVLYSHPTRGLCWVEGIILYCSPTEQGFHVGLQLQFRSLADRLPYQQIILALDKTNN